MVHRLTILLFRSLLRLFVLLAVSCSGKPSVYRVSGKVMCEGQPAAGAVVRFYPAEGANAKYPAPQGIAGQDGSFKITTYKANDGAPAGKYGVSVYWSKHLTSDDYEVLSPPRYMDPATSGFTAVVEKGSNELPPFELTKN